MSGFKSFRARFVLSVLALSFVLSVAVMGFIYFLVGGVLTEEVYYRLTATVGHSAYQIDNWFIEKRVGIDTMYNVMPLLPCEELMLEVLESFATSYVAFSNDRSIFGFDFTPEEGWRPTVRPWWINAMENKGHTVFTTPFIDAYTGGLIISASRYIGRIGGYDAVYAVDLFLPEVINMVWESIVIEGSYAFMTDAYGNIIVHTGDPSFLPVIVDGDLVVTNVSDVEIYRRHLERGIRQGEILPVEDEMGATRYLGSHIIMETGWMLYMSVPQSYVLDRLAYLLFYVWVFFLPFVLLIAVLAWYVIRQLINKPIYAEVQMRERKLLDDNKMLDRLNRMKIEFFQNMSHDFKTPLTVISTSANNIEDILEFGNIDNKEIRESLESAQHEVQRMSRMIDSAMKLSSFQDNRQDMEPVDIGQLFYEGAKTYRVLLERYGNNLSEKIPKTLPLVFGNADMLVQVLTNLLSNANRYTRNGEISIHATATDETVSVKISDNGSGVKPELLPDVFERGVSDKGSGLGLSICKMVIEDVHHGNISIQSEYGKGTEVTFSLPVYK